MRASEFRRCDHDGLLLRRVGWNVDGKGLRTADGEVSIERVLGNYVDLPSPTAVAANHFGGHLTGTAFGNLFGRQFPQVASKLRIAGQTSRGAICAGLQEQLGLPAITLSKHLPARAERALKHA